MSALGEKTLMGLLVDTESVEVLVREGLDEECIPTVQFRTVVGWTQTYFGRSGVAPSPAILVEHFGDMLNDFGVDFEEDVEETIEWALDDLKSSYVRNTVGDFNRRFALEITEAVPDDRLDIMGRYSSELSGIYMRLQPRTTQVDLTKTGDSILAQYDEAVASQGQVRGMGFGLPQIDSYCRGIWPGELALLAAGPKTGKSWMLNYVTVKEWERGRVAALYTLENSIEMAQMRLACVALHLDMEELQNGTLSSEDETHLREWVNDVLLKSQTPLLLMNPATVARTPQAIVQTARAYEADSLIIDQLSHMENGQDRRHQSYNYEVRDILRDTRTLIGSGRAPMPCLMAHQINRDGIKEAERTGSLTMRNLADSASAEREADAVYALYASEDMRAANQMQFQTLAARRFPPRDFDMMWHIQRGLVQVRNQVVMP